MEIRKHFVNYIKKHNISKDNLDKDLQNIGYINFFNTITTNCLGEPPFTHKKYHETTSSLIYVAESAKELLIPSLDIVHISMLYMGILTNSELTYNYSNYKDFLLELLVTRKQAKKETYYESNEIADIEHMLIKIYVNIVYGMIDKPNSVLTVGMESPRKYIVETSKKVMATIVSFYLNKSIPIYYISTDEIFVKHISSDEINELKKYYETECKYMINIDVSKLQIDDEEYGITGMVFSQKRFWVSRKVRVSGLRSVDDTRILLDNKRYFGKNFRDIFPEYTL